MPGARPVDDLTLQELRSALDEAIGTLPEKYRAPIVLCYLEGKSHDQAAKELGWPKNSVTNRVVRGRDLLRRQLERRGIGLAAGTLATSLVETAAAAPIPALLTIKTVKAAALIAAGKNVAGGYLTAGALALAEEAITGMLGIKGKLVLIALALGLAAGGAGWARYSACSEGPQSAPQAQAKSPMAKSRTADTAKKELSVVTDQYGDPLPEGVVARMGTMRLRRDDQSSCDFAFTPDGKALVSARNNKVIQFWDATTGQPLQALRHEKRFTSFALAADGKVLATAGFEEITIWDVASGKQLRKINIGVEGALQIAAAPDGKTLASVGEEKVIRLWDVASGEEKRKLAIHADHGIRMQFTPDGKQLLATDWPEIRAWEVSTGREVRTIDTKHVTSFALSPNGAVLASGGVEYVNNRAEARLLLWDSATARELQQLQGHEHGVDALAFSPDGTTLASAEVDKIFLWDVATGKELRRMEKTGGIKQRLVFSPNGKTLASTAPGNETVIRLWHVATGKPLLPPGPDGVIHTVAFSPDGTRVVTGSWHAPSLRLWDASTGKNLWACQGEMGGVVKVIFTPDGKGFFSSNIDGTLRQWDARTGMEMRKFTIPKTYGPVVEMALSTDGKRLTSVNTTPNKAQTVIVWDVQTGKRLIQREGDHPYLGNIMAFSPDAEIAAEPKGNLLGLWKIATGKLLLTLDHGKGENLEESAAFSPDGRAVAALTSTYVRTPRGYDPTVSTIHLWELATGKTSLRLAGGDRLQAVAYSPDCRMVAAVGKGVMQLWDVATGKQLLAYRGQESDVFLGAIAFSRDGTKLVAGYCDSTALVWDLTPGIRRAGALLQTTWPVDRSKLWTNLESADAAKAHAAVWTLGARPQRALELINERLKPVDQVELRNIRQLVMNLGSNEFAVRQTATRELERIDDQAEPLLRETLKLKPSLEVSRRIEGILAQPRLIRDPELLRRLRAIQVLELIGTHEALRLLQNHANGAPNARATQEAISSVERLARRGTVASP
jgi:WD40 repeat protein